MGQGNHDAGQRLPDGTTPSWTFTVHDATSQFSSMWPSGTGITGPLGVAQFNTNRTRWEIASMQVPGDFWGTLDGNLNNWDVTQSVTPVEDGFLNGWNPIQGSTEHLTAHNPPGGGNEAVCMFSGQQGDKVLCRWHVKSGLYQIVYIEHNDHQWQTLDVVTRTSLSIDFDAKTFSHKYYTRQIQLPPWTTIGDEVEH